MELTTRYVKDALKVNLYPLYMNPVDIVSAIVNTEKETSEKRTPSLT